MTKRVLMAPLLLAGLYLGACGTGKKLEVAQGQNAELTEQNRQLKSKVSSLNNDLNSCAASQKSCSDELAQVKADNKHFQDRLAMTNAVLKEQADIMHQIQNKVDDALADFKSKGVEVYFDKGLVHVAMEDKLLYKSGSSKLGKDGKDALTHLAGVLNGYPNLKVIVLGNTDDVKFKNGMDNWTLSTERANGVVRVLEDEGNMNPTRITAAGKGKYNPIAENNTEENRSKNRRTDIILNPDLDKLWESVDK
ncbi:MULTISPECIES: OmpA/MotB family protein [Niastella]|uniref:OmpA family protein n=1 Tax=Niastella soli TaxID=2821487 RepID=A0ABS3YUZ1_9BACT|nr:OmpA family protein [Niastella soli]MBO9201727.1 OmpA family protein [Niastella soli]